MKFIPSFITVRSFIQKLLEDTELKQTHGQDDAINTRNLRQLLNIQLLSRHLYPSLILIKKIYNGEWAGECWK
jgi:hypothetical protein